MAKSESEPRYVRPGWFTKHVFNPTVALLARAGVSVWVSLELRGAAKNGERRMTPVNPYLRRRSLPRGATRRDAMGLEHA